MNIKTIQLNPHDIAECILVDSEAYYQAHSRFFEARFRTRLWGVPLRDLTYRHPLNWIEAIKDRWFPVWLKKHFPVVYKEIKAEVHAVFPNWIPNDSLGRVDLLHKIDSKVGLYGYEEVIDDRY